MKQQLFLTLFSLFLLFPSIGHSQNIYGDQSLITIYVDKAADGTSPTAQNLHVYHRDQEMPLMFSIVSTGRENAYEVVKATGQETDSLTPVGRFGITRMVIDHVSELWDKAPMPYAIFFHMGWAIHGVYEWAYDALGDRASGGCVRLPLYMAAQLWDLVMKYGPENVEIVIYDGSDITKPLPRAYFH